ncbi:MAG: 30S ribosome-binding factor RbfA [Clostridia bacterium]|nr:30S ribosome-binding factor RbfA [Clostridia bacterium]
MAANRKDRMNEEVKKVLSEIIREMKDPRILALTSLTDVHVTQDLKYAKAKVSVYDEDEAARAACVEALNHAAGFLARELGGRMRIRAVPQLTFVLDDSIAYSVHIAKILNDLKRDGES